MPLEFQSTEDFGLERTSDILTQGFADYLVPITFSTAALLQAARTDSVDLAASRIVLKTGGAAGAALIARRGWTSRLAAMSLLPAVRRQGVGRALVTHLLAEAAARGERAMVLEVIEQNAPAVRLYEICGFRRVRRLVGFAKDGEPHAAAGPTLEEIDPRAVGAALATCRLPDLPWQLSSETLAHLGPPTLAFRLNDAWAAISNLATSTVSIRGLAFPPTATGCEQATLLLSALSDRFPGRRWEMKAIWPEKFGEVFTRAGFQRTELSQWQMVRDLPAAEPGLGLRSQ